jgi:hypothetical protein
LKTKQDIKEVHTIFDFTVQAVDCFGYNEIQGNCSIIRNRILINDIITLNTTQSNDITSIKALNVIQDTRIDNIEYSNSNISTEITNIKTLNVIQDNRLLACEGNRLLACEGKTSQLTKSASILDINNTCTQLRLNQDLNMNYKNITNLSNIICTGFNGLMRAFVSSSSIFTFESVLLGDTVNGSGFSFKSVKNGLSNLFKINYNTVDFWCENFN